MDYFPLFADVRQRPCLIVGAGQVALRKMTLLHRAGADITLVAPKAAEAVHAAHAAQKVRWIEAEFTPSHLTDHVLVISATNDDAVNRHVADVARAAGRLCNVVDDPANCSFITPAIVDRGGITVAVSSGGRSPTVARWVKAQIERALPQRVDALVALASRWRDSVRARVPAGQSRQRFWLRIFNGAVGEHVLAGRDAQAERAMTRQLASPEQDDRAGSAWLVGAGPGEADLITLRGAKLLSEADVVMHDSLVARSVLELARRDATFINVGKRAGHHSMTQTQITAKLVDLVGQGLRVCRLKGGDPFVFGRGGEEALALEHAGLSFEIVPGVTAASACGAYAGIPLTHRGVADSVTFVTAHGCQRGRVPDYADLVRRDRTVVFYMGVKRLPDIGHGLIAHGRDRATPVALVQNGGLANQQVITTTLGALAENAHRNVASPACVIVGEVVALAQRLAWYQPTSSASSHLPPALSFRATN